MGAVEAILRRRTTWVLKFSKDRDQCMEIGSSTEHKGTIQPDIPNKIELVPGLNVVERIGWSFLALRNIPIEVERH